MDTIELLQRIWQRITPRVRRPARGFVETLRRQKWLRRVLRNLARSRSVRLTDRRLDPSYGWFHPEMGGVRGKRGWKVTEIVTTAEWHGLDLARGALWLVPPEAGELGGAWLSGLLVDPVVRGSGLGTRVSGHLLALAAACGHRTVRLVVARTNPRAVTLYRDLGFAEVNAPGLLAALAERWSQPIEDAIIMELALPDRERGA